MKKLIAIVLSSLLLIGAAVGGTLALASDEERTVNVYTAGNIDIALVNGDNDSLTLFPAVYNFGTVSEKKAWELNDKGYWDTKVLRNVYQKDLAVKNVGKNDAYIRVIVAYENPKMADGNYFFDKCVVLNEATAGITRTPLGNAMIDGTNYALVSYLFADKVTPDKDVKHVVLRQLALKTGTTSEQMAKIGGAYDIMVCAQAVQTDLDQSKGGNSPEAMLNAAFYKLSDTMHPWAAATEKAGYTATAFPGIYTNETDTDPIYYVFNKNGLMNLNKLFGELEPNEAKVAMIQLMADIDLLGEVWEPINSMWVTFNGNGHTIKNLNAPGMDATGRRSGFWAYAGAVTINALTLENVTVNGSQAGIFAGSAEGLTITNCYLKGNNTVNFVAGVEESNGIGAITGVLTNSTINVTIDEDAVVTLNRGTMTTASGCVFVDALTGHIQANKGTVVNNGTVTVKGEVQYKVSTADELAAAVEKGLTNFYLADGEYDIKNCGGKALTINGSKNVVLKVMNEGEDGCDYGFKGSDIVTFNGVTIDTTANTGSYKGFSYMKGIFNDCNFVGSYSLNHQSDYVFNRCTFDFKNGYFWTWAATSVTFNDCTFNGNSKNILAHGYASTVIKVNNCAFAATEKGYASNGTVWTSAVEIDPAGNNTYTIAITNSSINENYSGWTRVKDGSTGHSIVVNGVMMTPVIGSSDGTTYEGDIFDDDLTDALVLQNTVMEGNATITVKRTYNTVVLENVTADVSGNLITAEEDNTIVLYNCSIKLDEGEKLIVTTDGVTVGQVMIHNVTVNGEMLTQETAAQYLENVNYYEVTSNRIN